MNTMYIYMYIYVYRTLMLTPKCFVLPNRHMALLWTCRAFLRTCRALLRICRHLWRIYMALLRMCRALLWICRALLRICRALLCLSLVFSLSLLAHSFVTHACITSLYCISLCLLCILFLDPYINSYPTFLYIHVRIQTHAHIIITHAYTFPHTRTLAHCENIDAGSSSSSRSFAR